MSFTGRLGTANSRPGNLELGVDETVDSGSLEQTVSQTLVFADQANANYKPGEGSNSLAFVSTATAKVDRPVSVNQTISFVQFAGQVLAAKLVEQTLTFVDSANVFRELNRSVSDTLVLAQNTLENIKSIQVNQTLDLSNFAEGRTPTIRVLVEQSLNLVQDQDGHLSVRNLIVAQALAFVDTLSRELTASVSQALSFTQIAERRNIITQSLGLTQTVLVGKGGAVSQDLGLLQNLIVNGVFGRPVLQPLGLRQSATFWVQRDCTTKQYTPFVGSTTDSGYTAPSTTVPTIGHTRLTLTYPYATPTNTLELRNPEFGDKDRLNFNRINRETRGGTLIVFADPKWPKAQTLVLQVDNLSQGEAADMLTFISQSLGKEIGLLDWENRQWRGLITTPDAQITHVGKHDRSIAFEFQGELV